MRQITGAAFASGGQWRGQRCGDPPGAARATGSQTRRVRDARRSATPTGACEVAFAINLQRCGARARTWCVRVCVGMLRVPEGVAARPVTQLRLSCAAVNSSHPSSRLAAVDLAHVALRVLHRTSGAARYCRAGRERSPSCGRVHQRGQAGRRSKRARARARAWARARARAWPGAPSWEGIRLTSLRPHVPCRLGLRTLA